MVSNFKAMRNYGFRDPRAQRYYYKKGYIFCNNIDVVFFICFSNVYLDFTYLSHFVNVLPYLVCIFVFLIYLFN